MVLNLGGRKLFQEWGVETVSTNSWWTSFGPPITRTEVVPNLGGRKLMRRRIESHAYSDSRVQYTHVVRVVRCLRYVSLMEAKSHRTIIEYQRMPIEYTVIHTLVHERAKRPIATSIYMRMSRCFDLRREKHRTWVCNCIENVLHPASSNVTANVKRCETESRAKRRHVHVRLHTVLFSLDGS